MEKKSSTTLLASFATIKALSDAKKYQSSYQILAEFIRDIILEETLYAFSATEMKNLLNSRFGFEIPEAVVRTSVRRMAGLTLEEGIYSVSITELGTDSLFREKQKEVDDTNTNIINLLVDYVRSRTGETVNCETLTHDLVAFLVDGQISSHGKYTDYIGEFILKNEQNKVVPEGLTKIREGSILYIGLNHRISEIGSITQPLTIYLGTEILFNLVGYNGEICSQLANDFFKLVQTANSGKQKNIALRYFSEVKNEIDDYFYAAESVVEGRSVAYIKRPAMIEITKGCSTVADIRVRKSDFYQKLKFQFGIIEDPEKNYYDESLFETNLESADYVDEEDKAKKRELAIKFVSHINKLRGGISCCNELESGFLLVTNSKSTLLISKEQIDKIKREESLEYISDFAVSLDRITSLLWYKLGNGFGNKEYPVNVNAVLKARIILSGSIAKNAEIAFSDTKKQYSDGIITEDQLAARIITLRQKPTLPEELQGDDIAEIMDFSPDFLSRFEEQVKSDRKALQEKNSVIEALSREKDSLISAQNAEIQEQAEKIAQKEKALSEKEATIARQKNEIRSHFDENQELKKELKTYREKEAAEEQKKNHRKGIWRIVARAFFVIVVTGIVLAISIKVCNILNPNFTNAISIAIGVLGIILTVYLSRKGFQIENARQQSNDNTMS